jgi:hypothetical protein
MVGVAGVPMLEMPDKSAERMGQMTKMRMGSKPTSEPHVLAGSS